MKGELFFTNKHFGLFKEEVSGIKKKANKCKDKKNGETYRSLGISFYELMIEQFIQFVNTEFTRDGINVNHTMQSTCSDNTELFEADMKLKTFMNVELMCIHHLN